VSDRPVVLVVEDEMVIAMLIQDALLQAGFAVVGPVRSSARAFDILDRGLPVAAVLDLNLGRGETTYPVAERLKSEGVPFLFLTGYGSEALRADFRGSPLLGKPFLAQQLADAVTQIFAARTS
jgi:DNA-binding response OmpR family regulator